LLIRLCAEWLHPRGADFLASAAGVEGSIPSGHTYFNLEKCDDYLRTSGSAAVQPPPTIPQPNDHAKACIHFINPQGFAIAGQCINREFVMEERIDLERGRVSFLDLATGQVEYTGNVHAVSVCVVPNFDRFEDFEAWVDDLLSN